MSDVLYMKELWERLRQDDTEAMMEIYEKSYADLLSYGVQLSNNNEQAKDAINDVFLVLWSNRSKLKPVENVRAYLFACIQRNIFQSATINRKMSAIPDDALLFGQEHGQSQEDILIAMQRSDEIRFKIKKAMEKLTDRQRELIRMKFFNGLDYLQIEKETGITMKTAYNTVYNAMKILTAELSGILFLLIILFFL